MVRSSLAEKVKDGPKLEAVFFRQEVSGDEPVRSWLKSRLNSEERRAIGIDIQSVQFGWPLGLPLVDHIEGDIWEVRTKLENRIARVFFACDGNKMVLLHGVVKKQQKADRDDIDLAQRRWKKWKDAK
jgi:phage-related protein